MVSAQSFLACGVATAKARLCCGVDRRLQIQDTVCVCVAAFRTAVESGGSVVWSLYGVEVRKRRTSRAEQQARERDEIQRKKDEDERMQRTLKELEEQRQVHVTHLHRLRHPSSS